MSHLSCLTLIFGMGVDPGQMPKIVFGHPCYLVVRSKVGVKVRGQGKGQGQISGAHVDILGLALPSAAKSNNSKFGAKKSQCVCL